MADRLIASYNGGRKTEKCHTIKEGDNGLILHNENSRQVGYIPYEKLDYVTELEE